jgi:hypothetical protein
MDAAASSVAKDLTRILDRKRIPISDAWYARATLAAHAADADGKQPRLFIPSRDTAKRLMEAVDNLLGHDESEDIKAVVIWIGATTGNRFANVMYLRLPQINLNLRRPLLHGDIAVEWRLTKNQRDRSKRHEEVYKFKWSVEPPPRVLRWFKKNAQETRSFEELMDPAWGRLRVAGTITTLLRRATSDPNITSYVFRDALETILKDDPEVTPELMEKLLDHQVKTSKAYYRPSKKEIVSRQRKAATKTKAAAAKKKVAAKGRRSRK